MNLFVVPFPQVLQASKFTTTVVLTLDQRVSIGILQAKRMRRGKKKPTIKAIMIEGLEMVMRKEKIK
jgi:hypothetical protein